MCTTVPDGHDILLIMAALTMIPAAIAAAVGAVLLVFLIIIGLVAGPRDMTAERGSR